MVLAEHAADFGQVGVHADADDALRADIGGLHAHKVLQLVGVVLVVGVRIHGLHDHHHGVHDHLAALGQVAHDVAVGDEAGRLAGGIDQRRGADMVVHQQLHGFEHGGVLGQRVHVALHDLLDKGTVRVVFVGGRLVAGLIAHERYGQHKTQHAQGRGHGERRMDAEHAGGHGIGRAGNHVGGHGGRGHDDGGTQRARHLAKRVLHGGSVVHQLVGQRIHAPGGDGHVHQRQAEQAHRVDDRERDEPHTRPHEHERGGGQRQHAGADDGQHARAVLVEQAAGDRSHGSHDDGAG